MTKRILMILAGVAAILAPGGKSAFAQTAAGARAFEQYCAKCHGDPSSTVAASDELKMRGLTGDEIYAALAKGSHINMQGPTDDEKREIALSLGGRKPGVAQITDAKLMTNRCSSNPPLGDVSANQTYGQPTVAGGRVFIGVDSGAVYSIDAATGCVYWSYQADASVRTAINIGPVKGHGAAKQGISFGDVRANVYMLDAATGDLLWKVKVEDHPVARITGAPTLYEGRLYVPVSSTEERAGGMSSVYPCCTFRGSVVALDANTGKQIWKTYTVAQAPKAAGKTSKGVTIWTSNGGAVWSSPTVDVKRHALYIGTGDAYTPPAAATTDAIMALDMATGKILWAHQDTENDAWLSGCGSQNSVENCPKDLGPDYDFGASPVLRNLPGGHRVLVAGQKSGMVWGHDPDQEGTVLWKTQLVAKLALGMITFGGAADDQSAYFGLRTGGVAAVRLTNGEKQWFTPIEGPTAPGPRGETAALTAIPGVIFSNSWEGVVRAFSSDNGHLLWEYNTARDFETVNGVKAKGGSMAAPGPAIVDGTVFVGSGYTFSVGLPGNVLLAFTAQ